MDRLFLGVSILTNINWEFCSGYESWLSLRWTGGAFGWPRGVAKPENFLGGRFMSLFGRKRDAPNALWEKTQIWHAAQNISVPDDLSKINSANGWVAFGFSNKYYYGHM